jgi:hypothetical protein
MKTRISAIVCLLCVVGYSDLSRAEDPSSQGGADPYAISADPPTMSSGTIEPYLSFMAGIAIPRSEDATFTDGTQPTVVKDIHYQTKHSVGGNAGIWFPTRNKLAGFDLGVEITGFIWYADVACCHDNYNRDPATGAGTTNDVNGLYVGSNFLTRYPMDISEAFPNGRWFPYVGIGVGAHQMAMKPGGQLGVGFLRAITEQRDTTAAFMGVGGIKAHVFKYVALFAEAKYIHAHHTGLTVDRFGQSTPAFTGNVQGQLALNPYASNIDTIFAHVGMSIHFDIKP